MNILSKINYRITNAILVLASTLGMGFALYLQHVKNLLPCNLCVFQRYGLIVLGLFALVALLHHPLKAMGRRFYALLMLIGIGWSAGIAGRHVWLQYLPADQVPACGGADLSLLYEMFPIKDVVSQVLEGSGDCAKISAQFLGFSIPEWSLAFFSILTIMVLIQFIKPMRNSHK